MSARPRPGRIALAVLCFLLGVIVGGCAVYLLEHFAEIGRPVYLGIFAAAALTTLGVADRLVNHRTPPPNDPGRTGTRRPG
ncbi:hypothetical protein [Kitasatospora mediocidica]|uniref:hypothetical protein n=1 Tax=Kitasatospora mediocidica TaxID=58352 RepID=UPI0005631A81|nr:hypothetical protein [Kitasatospora mediocidica]